MTSNDTPLWTPTLSRVASSTMSAFSRYAEQVAGTAFATYADLYAWSGEALAVPRRAPPASATSGGRVSRDGGRPGDRVAAYMPNIPETIVTMLATATLGATFTSASPDFGVRGVLDRFGQTQPKVLIACDGYWYNGKRVDILGKLGCSSPIGKRSRQGTVLRK